MTGKGLKTRLVSRIVVREGGPGSWSTQKAQWDYGPKLVVSAVWGGDAGVWVWGTIAGANYLHLRGGRMAWGVTQEL